MKWYFFSVPVFESKTKRKTFQSAFQAKVVKSAINISWSTPWSEKSRRLHPPWSGNSRRLRRVLESRAVSTLVAKVAPYPSLSRGIVSWSRRLYPWALKAAPYSLWPVPFPFWFHSRAASTTIAKTCILGTVLILVWKSAMSPFSSEKLHRLRLGLESRGNATLIKKPPRLPPRSRRTDSWSCRLHLALEVRLVYISVAKVLITVFGQAGQAVRVVVFWVAPFPESRRIHLGRESSPVSISVWKVWKRQSLVAPNPPWS